MTTLKGTVFELPKSLDKNTALALFLDKPLKPTRGLKAWAISGFPFPEHYKGGAVQTTSENCNNCHRHAGQKFSDFFERGGYPSSYRASTDEYGNMAGDDGILSLHFFDLKKLSAWGTYIGTNSSPDNRKWRDEFIQKGWLVDRKSLDPQKYVQTNSRPPVY